MPRSSVAGLSTVSQESRKSLGNRPYLGLRLLEPASRLSVGSRGAGGSREDLRYRCDTRVVVLPAVRTQSRYPAAQELESVLRSSAVVLASWDRPVRVRNRREGHDLHPNERVSPPTRETFRHASESARTEGTAMMTITREADRFQGPTHLQPVADRSRRC